MPEIKLYYLTRNKIIYKKKYPEYVSIFTYILRDLAIYFAITLIKKKFNPKVVYYFMRGLVDGMLYSNNSFLNASILIQLLYVGVLFLM